MAAKDIFHDTVKRALVKEEWQITHDPLTVKLTNRNIFIDLGAEKIIAAERENRKIAVEVKSFVGLSLLTDFCDALGKYQLYFMAMKRRIPDRTLYLAMPDESYRMLANDDMFLEILNELGIKFILFDPINEKITSWIN